jgi:hypothetical protein
MNENLKDEVLAAYAGYVNAFRANDVAALDNLIQYPLDTSGRGEPSWWMLFRLRPQI